ncbi:MAG: hypothetical protein LC667_01695 [Thioalkalivibrio sp.]|nr:hypothetical protein [Thioalkalivibrio sp.]
MRTWVSVAVLAAASFSLYASAQGALAPSGLPTFQSVIDNEALMSALWIGEFAGEDRISGQEPEHVANGLRAGVLPGAGPGERRYFNQLALEIATFVSELSVVGEWPGWFRDNAEAPVRFFDLNGAPGILVSGLGVGVEYNTFSTDLTRRSERVALETLLPELPGLGRALGESDLEYAGLSLTYGTRDFTSDVDIALPETLIGVFPIDALRRYARYEISDAELFAAGMLFTGDPGGIRRATIRP